MLARLGTISNAMTAGLLFLAWATSAAAVAAAEEYADEDTAPSALRGNQQPSLYNERLFPADDEYHAKDPITLALEREARAPLHRQRQLQNGRKRKERNKARQNGSSGTPSGDCSGSRPKKCGCPNSFQSDYIGTASTTRNGHSCIAWKDEHIAHYPQWGLEDGAVCRNPDGVASRAWCFTDATSKGWDYCDVRMCEHDGTMNPVSGGSGGSGGDSIPGCVDKARYYGIEADIQEILDTQFDDDGDKGHFMGGVLRMAAHDFMDYNQHDKQNPMGMDGCLDWTSLSNLGLADIWNDHTHLHKLYVKKYSDMTKADFWVAAANAIVHIGSVGKKLDLFHTYAWGRKDAESCEESALRLPTTESCKDVEETFLERMGMNKQDAVALLGAHTMGRGHREFSGHHGKWMPNDRMTTQFDKLYYEHMVMRAWSKRFLNEHDPPLQDWTTGGNRNDPKMMLNTDICLVWDLDNEEDCCTRTDLTDQNGRSRCENDGNKECRMYPRDNPRREYLESVKHMLNGANKNDIQDNFYQAFAKAWHMATTNGMHDLKPVMDSC